MVGANPAATLPFTQAMAIDGLGTQGKDFVQIT